MKKFFKGLMCVCLMLMVVGLPLVFVGCKKNYTINIEIVEGTGQVLKRQVDNESAEGKNTVKGGENFEFRIEPGEGQYIAEIEIDDIVYGSSYNEDHTYISFKDIDKSHEVKIKFAYKSYTITFMCVGEDGLYTEYKPLRTTVEYKNSVSLNDEKYGGENNAIWFLLDKNNTRTYIFNGKSTPDAEKDANYTSSNVVRVKGDVTLYCEHDAAWLDANL